jgi:hypothetical protein
MEDYTNSAHMRVYNVVSGDGYMHFKLFDLRQQHLMQINNVKF